ncbi:MAG TPA: D-alanyl-D-alanine carboxypeptidase [Caproicibacter sp.]|nr:D-alanyl-D-alanine carboxypeptidase [Caproicibacter sp.]
MHYRKKRSRYLFIILIAVISAAIFKFGPPILNSLQEKANGAINVTQPVDSGSSLTLIPQNPDTPILIDKENLHSPCAILVRLSDKAVLMQKQNDEKIYPASLTKMMTAIVAIETLPDLQKKVQLSSSIFQPLYKSDASMAGFQPGEKVQVLDLIYGALLPSGAECCIGLADDIAGSEQNFVEKMNQKAKQLGMSNTHFANSTGLQSENHYTTVKDLSILLSYALQNKTFRKIFTSSRHSTAATNKHPDGITFTSTLSQNLKDHTLPGGEILGGKTGYTEEAGLCLASLAKIYGKEYILVTAGAKGDHETEQYDIDDAREVYKELN